jgi:hypothetical protein
MVRIILVGVVVSMVCCPFGSAADELTRRALRGDAEAIRAFRSQGPEGLRRLLDAGGEHPSPAAKAAIDAVAAQKDAYAARLFWYTDLGQAKAAAAREGKPILSLRLLGRLDQELSCANSRFFRTTLYPDPAVSKLLREKFILHWSSERPVPIVTIDFGDGRVIKRTVTGNSAHYVLDSAGRPIDVVPGLYSASAFVRVLTEARELVAQLRQFNEEQRELFLGQWHRDAAFRLVREWNRRAGAVFGNARTFDNTTDDPQIWQRLAQQPDAKVPLSPQVRAAIAAKARPTAVDAGRLAVTKAVVESPLLLAIRRLEDSIAADTLHNELGLHYTAHTWFAQGDRGLSLELLNSRVYGELFKTPRSDPWLGLAPGDVYSGQDETGLARR